MIAEEATRYPLAWPHGWARTPAHQRQRASFSAKGEKTRTVWRENKRQTETYSAARPLTVAEALSRLQAEIDRLGATGALLSTNVQTRLDGAPRSDQAEPDDPGAAAYFKLKGQPRALACDRWRRVADNIAAIAQHIDALRRIDRYGVGTLDQAFAGYAALAPSAEDWWLVLGVSQHASLESVEAAFLAKARLAHPDAGGSANDMARLTEARVIARKAIDRR